MSEHFTSPFLLPDEEILALGISPHDVEVFRRKHYKESFGITTWAHLPEMAAHTFESIEVPISYAEGLALKAAYRDFLFSSRPEKEEFQLSEEEAALLKAVERRVDEVFERHPDLQTEGAFVKLATRSPKDAPHNDDKNPRYQALVVEELERLYVQHGRLDANLVGIAYFKSMAKACKVQNGAQVIELIRASERISADVGQASQFGEEHWTLSLVLRKWDEEVCENPQSEFRCFVHQKQLNAVTQYFCDFVYPEYLDPAHRESVEGRIVEFYESIKDHIPHPSFVIDFFVGRERVQVIELNPFHNGAGAGNFSWKDDRERMLHGPLEFRFTLEEPSAERVFRMMAIQWERFIKGEVRRISGQVPGETEESKEEQTKEKSSCILS